MSLKQTWTLTGCNAGEKEESSDLEMKINKLDAGEWGCKRLRTRYNDKLPKSWDLSVEMCVFLVWLCWQLNVCLSPLEAVHCACASVLKGSISHWASVVARKAGFTPTHRFPIDPPGNQAQNVCQVIQTEKGKLGSSTTHTDNTRHFPLYAVYGTHGTSLFSMDAHWPTVWLRENIHALILLSQDDGIECSAGRLALNALALRVRLLGCSCWCNNYISKRVCVLVCVCA